jgi:hypothetical protein
LFARSNHMSLLYMKITNYSTSSSHQKGRYRILSPKLRKLTYFYPLFVMLVIRFIRKFCQASMDTISHILNVLARTCEDWLIKDINLVKMMWKILLSIFILRIPNILIINSINIQREFVIWNRLNYSQYSFSK